MEGDEAEEIRKKIEEEIDRRAEPAKDIPFLVKSEVLEIETKNGGCC